MCTSGQMCLYQIVCLIYLMWSPQWILMATPMKFLLPRKGGRGCELLPSSNKCYIPYHPQMLSQKYKSEQAVLWDSPGCRMLSVKPREVHSTRCGQQKGASLFVRVDSHPTFTLLLQRICSPEDSGKNGHLGVEQIVQSVRCLPYNHCVWISGMLNNGQTCFGCLWPQPCRG